MSSHTQASND